MSEERRGETSGEPDQASGGRGTGIATPAGLFGGRLVYRQPEGGFRTAVDSLALVRFVDSLGLAPRAVCDLGCGSGFLALCCALLYPDAAVTGVEISEARASAAEGNAEANGLTERVSVLRADLRELGALPGGPADLVISNPPFTQLGRGPLPRDADKAMARFETHLDMEAVVLALDRLLAPEGTGALIYPSSRAGELEERLASHGLVVRRMRPVRARGDLPESHVLCACGRGPAEDIGRADRPEESPLLLEGPGRTLGPELAELVSRFDLTSPAS